MSGGDDSARQIARALTEGPLQDVRAALPGVAGVWAVGGTLRDLLLGRLMIDVDLAVQGDVKAVARALHDRLKGDIFSVSERFGTWRVQPAGREWGVDLTLLRGETIERDLALRDFSVNAMAVSLTARGNSAVLVDPHGGLADLQARRLRVLGEHAYADDALRPLRLARLAAVLGFEPDTVTADLTRKYAPFVTAAAAERIFAELRGLVNCEGVLRGIELLDELGLMAAVLPELTALKGVEQSVYHHLDAYDHTIDVLRQLIELQNNLGGYFGADAGALAARLDEPLAEGLTRGQALRWAALLHDIAKRETRTVHAGGHVGFPGHDQRGEQIVRAICARLHAAERFTRYVAALTREHLRLGFLVKQQPLSRREVYAYMRACEPVEVEVGVLSAADRLATRGRKADVAIEAHLGLARELNHAALSWRAVRSAEPLVRGDRLVAELGIEPGPRLGELLERIAEERFAGELSTAEQALAFARTQL